MRTRNLHGYFVEAFSQLNRTGPPPDIEVVFYPYAGLNNTIRVRQRRVLVRISDVLTDAPPDVLKAIAFILVAKLFRRRIPKSWDDVYRSYTATPQVVRSAEQTRRRRGRKMLTSAQGKVYNLAAAFARLNAQYFDNTLRQPKLSWSQRSTYRIFGHHDPVHDTIIISRTLDDESVSRYVLDYILYHEMLHLVHRPKVINGRWYYHTPEFKADERNFVDYEKAIRWFEEFRVRRAGTRKKRATPRKGRKSS